MGLRKFVVVKEINGIEKYYLIREILGFIVKKRL